MQNSNRQLYFIKILNSFVLPPYNDTIHGNHQKTNQLEDMYNYLIKTLQLSDTVYEKASRLKIILNGYRK